jgi:hypothetical protein
MPRTPTLTSRPLRPGFLLDVGGLRKRAARQARWRPRRTTGLLNAVDLQACWLAACRADPDLSSTPGPAEAAVVIRGLVRALEQTAPDRHRYDLALRPLVATIVGASAGLDTVLRQLGWLPEALCAQWEMHPPTRVEVLRANLFVQRLMVNVAAARLAELAAVS